VTIGSPELREQAARWYGSAPAKWRVERFKHIASIRNGQVDPEDESYKSLPLFAPNHIESGTGRLLGVESADAQGAESGKYLVEAGEVIYSKIRPGLRKVVVAPCRGLCSADMYPIEPAKHIHARFLYYAMLGEGFSRYALLESDRVAMPKINREALGECVFLIPHIAEQVRLAAFLDRKTASIDSLIAKKRRLIELLQEKRQALITLAIKSGLNSDVPMKESGVPAIGEVPAHWALKPLMYLTAYRRPIMYGIVLPGPNVEEGIPIVKSGDCVSHKLRLDRLHRTTAAIEAPYARARLEPDDIVYAIRGSIGMAAVVPAELRGANLTQDAARIAPRKGINTRWLLYAVQSGGVWAQLEAGVVGATVKGINIRDLKRPVVPVPCREEQDAIAAHLDRAVSALDATRRRAERGIALLQEYRQALITAAVTAQIDESRAL
jgi:type I restriction enzyme S subunit